MKNGKSLKIGLAIVLMLAIFGWAAIDTCALKSGSFNMTELTNGSGCAE